MRRLVSEYAIPGTWTYTNDYLNYEQYYTFVEDTIRSSASSFAAVCGVILLFTASITATILVAICVAFVDLFLLALLYYWGLTFNTIVVLQIVIALGLAVDYSAHIAHCYLIVEPAPGTYKNDFEKRKLKVRKALA